MNYGPPPEPNESAPQPEAAAPGPDVAYSSPVPPPGPVPPHPHPQQPWIGPSGPEWPGGRPPADRPMGPGLAVAAVVLGLLAWVLPLLPVNLDLLRQYVAFPPAVGGLVLAIGGCTGHRRGKPLAVAGAILCVLALVLVAYMVAGNAA
ncbi:hypothetical protein ACFPA8_12080 [Streptomyces ovatisporus]|uniref:Integral membrane protein n=1 Tax=Streptomyces ovatisporus TaxID=1128682 RepID=A0ABV9A4P7_9ACTN